MTLKFRGRSRGQAFVEFAILLPLMLLILLLAVDFGRLFFSYIQVNNAVREAANYASLHAADDGFILADYNAAAQGAASGETNAQAQRGEGLLSVEAPFCFTPPASESRIECDAASDFAPEIGNQVRVTASLPFTFFTPLISSFFGGALPLTASATAPVLNPPAALATPDPTPVPGSLVVRKALAGDLTGFEGGDFEFDISCGGRAYGPVTVTVPTSNTPTDAEPITGIPDGAVCTVTETDKARPGAHGSWDSPSSGQATIATDTQTSVTITNTRTYNPPGNPTPVPTPTPGPCVVPTVTIAPASTTSDKQTLSVDFTGTSTESPASWAWDFDDGTTVTTPGAARHKFTYTLGRNGGPQTWTVTLTVTTGPTCSGSATATVTLNP